MNDPSSGAGSMRLNSQNLLGLIEKRLFLSIRVSSWWEDWHGGKHHRQSEKGKWENEEQWHEHIYYEYNNASHEMTTIFFSCLIFLQSVGAGFLSLAPTRTLTRAVWWL